MNTLRNLNRSAILCIALLLAGPANADARLKVEADGELIRLTADIDTRVDRDQAWQVLSDYGHWSEFVPDLLVSRVISRPGEPIRVEQRGRIPMLPNFPLVMINQVEETPHKSIRFLRVAGNVQSFVGEWQILGKSPVRLVYRSIIEPGFPMPPEVSIAIFRQDAKVRIEAMASEMERRANAGANPASR